jgi:ribose transport system substrate-binding protein
MGERRGAQRSLRLLLSCLVIASVMALAACGGDDNKSDAGGSGGGAASTAATTANVSDAVTKAKARMEQLYAGEDFDPPPATAPKAEPGKNVWVVVTGLAFAGSALFADAAKAGAKELGWTVTVYDGKFSPDRYQDGIRQAIADKADGILLYNVDCNLAQSALEQARKAKVPIVATESVDCSFSKADAESLFDAQVTYTSGDFPALTKALGQAQADWIISKTEGKAKVIHFKETDLQTAVLIADGFDAQIKTCTTCEVVDEITFVATDLGPKLQEKAQQALLQHPDANAVMTPYDDVIIAGIGAAIKASGRAEKLNTVAGAGYASNVEIVKKRAGQDGGYSVSIPWEGWHAIDTINRVFAGEEAVSSGIGVGFFDREHNLPESGPTVPPVDFVAAYKKAWAAAK